MCWCCSLKSDKTPAFRRPNGFEENMSKHILILPGDGIGPEIMAEAVKVLNVANEKYALDFELVEDVIGGAAIDKHGVPLADETLALARKADAVLLGAVGGPKWDKIERDIRPERGLLKIRSQLGLFGNLRPAILYPQLAEASTLKPEVVSGLDILIVRELTGGIYFGQPRGTETLENGERKAFDTLPYSEKFAASPRSASIWRACVARSCARWTRRTCSRPASCGGRSWKR
jgi:3-isopropylmalate dehydrogenase